jgi:DNA-binding LytR/AlgR family response regulator
LTERTKEKGDTMKLKIEEDEQLVEPEITIRCPKIDESIVKLSEVINNHFIRILGKKEGMTTILNLDEIYYFEVVENRLFAYTEKEVYEVNYKLQQLATILLPTAFIQTSRTMLLNIAKIKRIRSLVNGRIMAILDNGEKTVITRVYANDFKHKLKG